jgi:hypothetical protein
MGGVLSRRIQSFGVELARSADLEIEVARRRLHGRVDQLAGSLLLEKIVFAEQVVDRIEDVRLQRCVNRFLPRGCHGGNIGRIVRVATAPVLRGIGQRVSVP